MHNDRGWVYGTHYHPAFPGHVSLPNGLDEESSFRHVETPKTGQNGSLNEECSSRDTSLHEDSEGLSEESSRHNSPNNSPKEKEARPATPAGVFFSDGKNQDEIRLEDVSSPFDAFLSEYKGGVAHAGAKHAVPAGGETKAKAIWVKLTSHEQADARAAMQNRHRGAGQGRRVQGAG